MQIKQVKHLTRRIISLNFKLFPLITIISWVIASLPVLAETKTDVKMSGLIGSDSNAHKLMDAFNPASDTYLFTDLKFKSSVDKKLKFSARYRGSKYQDDATSEWSKIKVDMAYKSKIKLENKRKLKYKISLDYNRNDTTYVSKFTGQVLDYLGESIGDRYDANIINLNGELGYKTKNKTVFNLIFQHRNKKYHSYNLAGLSNLDYSHNGLGGEAIFLIDEKSSFSVQGNFTKRVYLDRRAKDLDGLDIVGTDLEYNLFTLKGIYRYDATEDNQWIYTAKYGQRTDNAVGYWDSKSNYLSVYTRQKFGDDHRLTAKLKYSIFDYDNRVDAIGASLDEQPKENKGFTFDLEHRWVFYRENKSELATYVMLSVNAFTSSTPEYEFQRNQISFGLRWDVN